MILCLGNRINNDSRKDAKDAKIGEIEKIFFMVRNAENGCFTMQALLEPVRVTNTVTLNGSPLLVAQADRGE